LSIPKSSNSRDAAGDDVARDVEVDVTLPEAFANSASASALDARGE
jgi:hypothetical protein